MNWNGSILPRPNPIPQLQGHAISVQRRYSTSFIGKKNQVSMKEMKFSILAPIEESTSFPKTSLPGTGFGCSGPLPGNSWCPCLQASWALPDDCNSCLNFLHETDSS